jgi:hypothetical protein
VFTFDFGDTNVGAVDVSTDDVDSYVGKHVVVRYDNTAYPGLVLDQDGDEIYVTCMYKVGRNRFLWPRVEDTLWYAKEQIIMVIPVTKRHLQVEPQLWDEILQMTD